MPELPEVETVVRGLRRHLPGRRIVELRLGKTDFIDDPVAIGERVPGSLIRGVRRHGKFLVLELERGGEARVEELLVVHLGMTGQLIVVAADAEIAPHTHAFFTLDDRRELRFRDPRRFGRMLVAAPADGEKILGPLGADPLEVSEADFRRLISSRRARIKALLLDQHVFRGMGNIYTDESLWKAKIHPARLGANLKVNEIARLQRAMLAILEEAIRLGGSSISDYVGADGEPGEFQIRHRAYDREGKKCFRCGAKIRRIIVAGRSSYFCPKCQRAPHGRRSSRTVG
ncbi:MAG: bifunctional DNA-formamidopyrimidine glycosylase/DNA-(apurinic or apyrimidinic site) lyase [Candidatus Acidiferrales bacterium]